MKKRILLSLSVLAITFTMHATEEYWIDVNFTRDSTMWKEAFPPLVLSGDGLNLLSSPNPNGQYLGFGLNGAFGRFAVSNYNYTPFNAENIAEQFVYAIRLSNNQTSYWSFPGTSDVGKLKVNFLCGNATSEAQFTVQKFVRLDGEGEDAVEVWEEFDPVVKFEVPPHNFSTTSSVIEKELNLTEPSKLRLKGPTLRNIHIYAMSISKNQNSGFNEQLTDIIRLSLVDRTLEIQNRDLMFSAAVINLAGSQIGQFKQGEKFVIPVAGAYLIRIETNEGTVTRKINVL